MLESTFAPLRDAWRHASFRRQAAATLCIALPVLVGLTRFLDAVERRSGVVLPDPVLALFPARDFTWMTFVIIYAGVLGGIGYLVRHPRHLLLAVQTYLLMVLARIIGMFLMPLDPPPGMIALKDPFVEFFGSGNTLTRDLFFSGHTATVFIVALAAPGRMAKIAFLVCTVAVAACVLLQHVHYAIDVFAAPFFAYGCYRLASLLQRKLDRGDAPGGTS